MTARQWALDALVGLGVGIELVCSLGMLVMRTAIDRLHYVTGATTVGPLPIVAAVVVREGVGSSQALSAFLIAAVLVFAGPIVTSATARALRLRERGSIESTEAERQ